MRNSILIPPIYFYVVINLSRLFNCQKTILYVSNNDYKSKWYHHFHIIPNLSLCNEHNDDQYKGIIIRYTFQKWVKSICIVQWEMAVIQDFSLQISVIFQGFACPYFGYKCDWLKNQNQSNSILKISMILRIIHYSQLFTIGHFSEIRFSQ